MSLGIGGKGEGSYNYVLFDHDDVEIQGIHFNREQQERLLRTAEKTEGTPAQIANAAE